MNRKRINIPAAAITLVLLLLVGFVAYNLVICTDARYRNLKNLCIKAEVAEKRLQMKNPGSLEVVGENDRWMEGVIKEQQQLAGLYQEIGELSRMTPEIFRPRLAEKIVQGLEAPTFIQKKFCDRDLAEQRNLFWYRYDPQGLVATAK